MANWEQITTLEQAIMYTGMSLPSNIDDMSKDIQAFYKLRVIVAAYNSQTISTLNKFPAAQDGITERWYYHPCIAKISQTTYNGLSEVEKQQEEWIAYGSDYICCIGTMDAGWVTNPLCFNNGNAATACAKRFLNLWADYIFR